LGAKLVVDKVIGHCRAQAAVVMRIMRIKHFLSQFDDILLCHSTPLLFS
jgi:hypothetical protein